MIPPTVGRMVWFTPSKIDDDRHDLTQPLAAIIASVWSDRMINIAYFDQDGVSGNETSVALLQDDDSKPGNGRFCTWMPYQLGQAAKTEAVQAQLASTGAQGEVDGR